MVSHQEPSKQQKINDAESIYFCLATAKKQYTYQAQ
jgi:hypothetical protein